MSGRDLQQRQSSDIDAFLKKVASTPAPIRPNGNEAGRLLFALDATMSRQPTWDRASHLQSEMFDVTSALGGLAVQIAFFRGHRDFRASPWLEDSQRLKQMMASVSCQGGHTQIARLLRHAIKANQNHPVRALVFIGDSMEEDADELCHLAGEMGLKGLKGFFFQEGHEPGVEQVFKQMAKLSGGAWCRFDEGSADQLAALLRSVAIWAAGGLKALGHHGNTKDKGAVRLLTGQIG